MKTRPWKHLVVLSGLLIAGCYYSPWKNLGYEVLFGAPSSVFEVEQRPFCYSNYRIDDVIVGVTLGGVGYWHEEHPPYSFSIFAFQPCVKGGGGHCIVIENLIVRYAGSNDVLYTDSKSVRLCLKADPDGNTSIWARSTEIRLPEHVSPTNGRFLEVSFDIASEGQDEKPVKDQANVQKRRHFVYFFRPVIKSGYFSWLTV